MEARLRRDRLEWEIQQNREELERQDQELQAVNEEIIKRRQELEDAIEEELGIEKEVTEEFRKLPSQQKKSIEHNQEKSHEKSPKESDKSEKHLADFDHMYSVKRPPPEMPKSPSSGGVSDPRSTAANRETHGQLERIRIPIFSGNKMDFQRWNAAFTSCVDMTSLSPQFKMLRLEACLAGQAANTIKGLGYSLEAYEAAKSLLFRKY